VSARAARESCREGGGGGGERPTWVLGFWVGADALNAELQKRLDNLRRT